MKKLFGLILYSVVSWANAADLTGFTEEFPPFNYVEDGRNLGLANEIIDRISAKTGLSVDRHSRPWLRAVSENEVNFNSLLYTTVRTPERELKYKWVGPFDSCDVWLIKLKKRTDIQLKTIDDAKKFSIGSPRGSAGHRILLSMGFNEKKLDLAGNEEQQLRKLYGGRFDLSTGMLSAHRAMAKIWKLEPQQLESALLLKKGLGCYFAFNPKVDPKLFQRFSDGFSELEHSGDLKKIRDNYIN